MRWCALLAVIASVGCKQKAPPAAGTAGSDAAAVTPPPAPPPPVTSAPIPPGSGDGAIGAAGAFELVAAADDGGWVALCQDRLLHVVLGDGEGLLAQHLMAASDRDLVVASDGKLIHLDVVARTRTRLGNYAPVVIDADSRRVIRGEGAALIVERPGAPPRTIATAKPVVAMVAHGPRWLEVAGGAEPTHETSRPCGWLDTSAVVNVAEADRRVIDLDPEAEATDRIGPELGVGATGEITLDGAVVVGPDCIATVVGALADPPRALVQCEHGPGRVVGPGFDQRVPELLGSGVEASTIADHVRLGERLVCVAGTCVDLIGGRSFPIAGHELVWFNGKVVVRAQDRGLWFDELDGGVHRELALPAATQTVTLDTVTGRRRVRPAPPPPRFVDGAGDYLLYGRHVVDVAGARLIATLDDDALAIDRSGRILVATAPGQAPLRWRKP